MVWTPGSEVNSKLKNQSWYYGHNNTYHYQVGIVCCLRKVSPIFVVWLKCQLLRLLYDDQLLLLGRRRVSFQKNKKNFDKLSVGQNHFYTKGSRTHKLVPAQKISPSLGENLNTRFVWKTFIAAFNKIAVWRVFK